MQTINKKGLNVKDLVTVGIFSALFLVFALVGGIFFAPNPVLTFYMPMGSALLCGPVYLLMLAKVQKRWAVTILGAILCIIWFITGMHWAMALGYLFHDTVANNIRFGQPGASMEKVIEVSQKARCHDFIMKLPKGYDTVIGEAGGSLSGGERQRLSIARAMMKDAPIIILDEATANIDPENEKELMEAVNELTREKTVIMIAHRLKTVRNADQILVVDNGQIVQHGTHDELMNQDGIYRHFITGREKAVGWKL